MVLPLAAALVIALPARLALNFHVILSGRRSPTDRVSGDSFADLTLDD
jgi:hypothetical protein